MSLPRGDEYVAAIQHPRIAFGDPNGVYGDRDLERCGVATGRTGIPIPLSGGFTMTFHCVGAGDWAVRCFTLEVRELNQRYDAITQFLRNSGDRLFTPAELVPQGILVKGARYDIIRMGWVSGEQLNSFVGKNVLDAAMMQRLGENVFDMGTRLVALHMAHGDLQHGNILVDPNGGMRLVDYDDMYLPALASLSFSSGLGHRNFQHPDRSSHDFGPAMDRFSLFSMYVTFLALAEQPALWRTYGGGDERLLFTRDDYLSPESSPLFQDLARLRCSAWVDKFAAVCKGAYDKIPSLSDFIDGRFPYARFDPKTVRATVAPGIARFAAALGTQPASAGPGRTPPGFAQSTFVQSSHAQPQAAPSFQQSAPQISSLRPTPKRHYRVAWLVAVALVLVLVAWRWSTVRSSFAPQQSHPHYAAAPTNPPTAVPTSTAMPNEAWFGGKPISAILRSTSAIAVSKPPIDTSCTGVYVSVSGYGAGCADPTQPEMGVQDDGTQLMILPIESGGSGGVFYALLYELRGPSPAFLGVLPGDGNGHLSTAIDSGYIIEQWQQPGSAECCPEGYVRQRSVVQNGRVIKLDKALVAITDINPNGSVGVRPEPARQNATDSSATSQPAQADPSAASTPQPESQDPSNTGSAAVGTVPVAQCTDSDSSARVDQQAKPVAPAAAFGAVPGTTVQIAVSVDADGKETDASIQTPNVTPALTTAALNVARASSYIPATLHCQGRASVVTLTVTF